MASTGTPIVCTSMLCLRCCKLHQTGGFIAGVVCGEPVDGEPCGGTLAPVADNVTVEVIG